MAVRELRHHYEQHRVMSLELGYILRVGALVRNALGLEHQATVLALAEAFRAHRRRRGAVEPAGDAVEEPPVALNVLADVMVQEANV